VFGLEGELLDRSNVGAVAGASATNFPGCCILVLLDLASRLYPPPIRIAIFFH
jgi:hypothetical protein